MEHNDCVYAQYSINKLENGGSSYNFSIEIKREKIINVWS